jgi:hypothetical protein
VKRGVVMALFSPGGGRARFDHAANGPVAPGTTPERTVRPLDPSRVASTIAGAAVPAGTEALMHVLVAYASRHGATQGIAHRIAARLRADGLEVTLQPAA